MNHRWSLIVGSVIITSGLLVAAGEKFKKEFVVGENVELIVDADVANIEASQGDKGKIVVRVELPDAERYTLASSQDEEMVVVSLEHKGLAGWLMAPFDLVSDDGPRITLELPEGIDAMMHTDAGEIRVEDYTGNVNVRTDAGNIWLERVEGDAHAASGSGTIRVKYFEGTLTAKSNAGTVRVRDSEGEFDLSTDMGVVNIDRVFGSFVVNSNFGNIDFDGAVTEGDANKFKSGVGGIDLTFYNGMNMAIDAESDMGTVDISPVPQGADLGENHLKTIIGTGDVKINVRTDMGSISIRKGQDWSPESGLKPEPQIAPLKDPDVKEPTEK